MTPALRAAITGYLDEGWAVVPIAKDKACTEKDWSRRTFAIQDFAHAVGVGVRPDDGLQIVDVDEPRLCPHADRLLPRTDRIDGRPGKSPGHFFFEAPGLTHKTFTTPTGEVLVEILSAQAVLPPTPTPTGPRDWIRDGAVGRVDPDGLYRSVRNTAAAGLLGLSWPAQGSRHDAALAAAGYLLTRDVHPGAVEEIVRVAALVAGDEEVEDRARAAYDTAAKREANQRVSGGPTLRDLIDTAAFDRLTEWFDGTEAPGLYAGHDQDITVGAKRAWRALQDVNDPPRLFRRGGLPVRVITNDRARVVFQDLNEDRLKNELARAVSWYRTTAKGERVPAAPPPVIARNMLADAEFPLPLVTRIVHAPIVAADGTIVLAPGYHPATRTYYAPPGLDIQPVAAAPTQTEIDRARGRLLEPLRDFPFTGPAERAHAVVLTLQPFIRELIDGLMPMGLIEKQSPGTGAGLLTKAALLPALGHEISAQPATGDDDEWRKRITAILLEGPPVVLFDNAETLVSPSLAALLTTRDWKDRVLGGNRTVELPNDVAWIATGNNLTLSTDIMRRCVRIRLDAQVDRPWRRPTDKFAHPDLLGWIAEHRADLVWAALTIIRAWIAAGRPAGTKTFGSFEAWARVMGGVLEVAGIPGFLDNVEEFYEASDTEGDAIREFLEGWRRSSRTAESQSATWRPSRLARTPPW